MNKLLIYCLLVFLNTAVILAQSTNFGSVVLESETNTPVHNAIVEIEGTTLIVRTDEKGRFRFNQGVPYGEHVITITKPEYLTRYFLIKSEQGKSISVDKIEVEVTKTEAKKRKKQAKKDKIKLKEAEKAKKEKDKLLAKKKKKLRRKNSVDVAYDDNTPPPAPVVVPDVVTFSEAQYKYSNDLGVPVEILTNQELYDFIDDWEGTTYLLGGETKDGIDCSSFTQRLYSKALGMYIERTAAKQYNSKYTDKFRGKEFLQEGDLLFFKGMGETTSDEITHVGVYLHNNKFVHSTSTQSDTGTRGVKISDLTHNYWSVRFVSGGRRINNN